MMPRGGARPGWPARAALVVAVLFVVGPPVLPAEGGEQVQEFGYVQGPETAPVTIQVFSSLTCPSCAKLHLETLEPLAGSYVAEGRVLLVGFMAAMLRAWWLDLGIDCGCFGIGQAVSPGTLARDGALTLLSIAVTAGAFALSRRPPGTPVADGVRGSDLVASGEGVGSSPSAIPGPPVAAALGGVRDQDSRP